MSHLWNFLVIYFYSFYTKEPQQSFHVFYCFLLKVCISYRQFFFHFRYLAIYSNNSLIQTHTYFNNIELSTISFSLSIPNKNVFPINIEAIQAITFSAGYSHITTTSGTSISFVVYFSMRISYDLSLLYVKKKKNISFIPGK